MGEYAKALASLDQAEGLLTVDGQAGGPARRARRALLLSQLDEQEAAVHLLEELRDNPTLPFGHQMLCREAIEMLTTLEKP